MSDATSNQTVETDPNGFPVKEDKKEEQELNQEKEVTVYDITTFKYTRKNIDLTYAFLFYANMSLNFDHGAMSAGTKALEEGLDVNAQ